MLVLIDWRRLWWRGFWHWPHVHGNVPVGLDYNLPYLWKNDLAIRSDEVVMAVVNVRPDDVHVQEGLLDELLHSLNREVSQVGNQSKTNPTYLPSLAEVPWEAKFATNSVFEFDWGLWGLGWCVLGNFLIK